MDPKKPRINRGREAKSRTKLKSDIKRDQGLFLQAFRDTVHIGLALKKFKIAAPVFHAWLKTDAEFAELWAEAQDQAAQTLEDEAVRRGMHGYQKGIYYKGQYMGSETEYSDQLLIQLLRRYRPAQYRENYHVEHSGTVNLAEKMRAADQRLIAMRKNDPTGTS